MSRKLKKETIIYSSIFAIYAVINFILLLYHEPWRDEIHSWLLAKELSIPELIVVSRFDGHPILWHLILMPFAKLNFPIITLSIIGYVIMLITVWLFLFKTNLNLVFKIIVTFTIPFTYIYSAISRNYCLVVLFLIIIANMYDKRYEKPILYSLMIALLVHTHSLAWGIVAGLTITFHFDEIFLFFRKKNHIDIKKAIIGLVIIAISTILVVAELYGTANTDYKVVANFYTIFVIYVIMLTVFWVLLCSLINKSNYREFLIILIGFTFHIYIYLFVYSLVLFQRYMLIFAMLLFYIILLSKTNLPKNKLNIICLEYIIIILMFAFAMFGNTIINEIKLPYSSAKEMAYYINENLPENTTILIDASIIGQSMIPYVNSANFYDITYKCDVECCADASYEEEKILNALENLDSKYSGCYLIVCNDLVELDYDVIYKTKKSFNNEDFTLYYIP